MKKVLIAALFAATLAFAQEAPHGGAEAVHPGGPVTQQPGETHGATHGEAAAKQGEGHEAAPMPNEIWWKWANFALLAIALGYLINKHAGGFFASRTEEIRKGIEESTRTREEAEARAAEIERRVGNLSAEVDQIREQSREELARERQRVQTETEAQLRKIQAQSEAEIDAAARLASKNLKAHAAQLALELAEQQLAQRLNQPAQDELTQAFVADLRQKTVKN